MKSILKQILLLLAFSASIVTHSTNGTSLYDADELTKFIMEHTDFKKNNPQLVQEYNQAFEAALNSPSYQEYNAVGRSLKTHHQQLISRKEALQYVLSKSLPLSNVIFNKLSIDDFYDNCDHTRRFDTPQCTLYNQLANEYSEKHRQLLSQYNQLEKAYHESPECLNLAAINKKIENEFMNQKNY